MNFPEGMEWFLTARWFNVLTKPEEAGIIKAVVHVAWERGSI
jgi:hypothetical protein